MLLLFLNTKNAQQQKFLFELIYPLIIFYMTLGYLVYFKNGGIAYIRASFIY